MLTEKGVEGDACLRAASVGREVGVMRAIGQYLLLFTASQRQGGCVTKSTGHEADRSKN